MNEKRGRNFTGREKFIFLQIVDKFKNIIDDKCTNAMTVSKKNRAWEAISCEFNSEAEVSRTPKQLLTLYFNLKRNIRRQSTGKSINMQHCIDSKDSELDGAAMEDLKRQVSTDKSELNKFSGGEVDPHTLTLFGHQIKPLPNTYDSAASYYGSTSTPVTWPETQENMDVLTPEIYFVKTEDSVYSVLSDEKSPAQSISLGPESPPAAEPKTTVKKSQGLRQKINNSKCKKKNVGNEYFKKKYYQYKMESAIIEKQTKIVEKSTKLVEKRTKLIEKRIKLAELELAQKKIKSTDLGILIQEKQLDSMCNSNHQ